MNSTAKWVVAGCAVAGAAAVIVSLRRRAAASRETALNRAERLVRQAQSRVTEMQSSLEAFRQAITKTAPEAAR